MASIQDSRGYNQGFKPSEALSVRFERRCDRMLQHMIITPDTKVLELGCGIGELSHLVASKTQARVTGSDLNTDFISEANAKYHLKNLEFKTIELGSSNAFDEKENQYDYIIGNGILHHVYRELPAVLAQLRCSLRPGGKIIFWEPNIFNPYIFLIFKLSPLRQWAKLEPTEMAFSGGYIQQKLKDCQFKNIMVKYSDFLLPNTPNKMVKAVAKASDFLDEMPGINRLAQSIFICAQKNTP